MYLTEKMRRNLRLAMLSYVLSVSLAIASSLLMAACGLTIQNGDFMLRYIVITVIMFGGPYVIFPVLERIVNHMTNRSINQSTNRTNPQ